MSVQCRRCHSASLVRTYDTDGGGTLLKCVACGCEDYASYQPVRKLPRFVVHTESRGPNERPRADMLHEARKRQVYAFYRDGLPPVQVSARTGINVRTVNRYYAWFRAELARLAVSA